MTSWQYLVFSKQITNALQNGRINSM